MLMGHNQKHTFLYAHIIIIKKRLRGPEKMPEKETHTHAHRLVCVCVGNATVSSHKDSTSTSTNTHTPIRVWCARCLTACKQLPGPPRHPSIQCAKSTFRSAGRCDALLPHFGSQHIQQRGGRRRATVLMCAKSSRDARQRETTFRPPDVYNRGKLTSQPAEIRACWLVGRSVSAYCRMCTFFYFFFFF